MTSKPKGMIETTHLIDLLEHPTNDMWGLAGEAYGFRPDRAYVDDRTGEIFCEWLGSLVDL
jgi:hypothetical protein